LERDSLEWEKNIGIMIHQWLKIANLLNFFLKWQIVTLNIIDNVTVHNGLHNIHQVKHSGHTTLNNHAPCDVR
jgi:hypothetical protein